ncbi:hypothetical protein D8M33_10350, partial [Micrococcus sp. HSID17245]
MPHLDREFDYLVPVALDARAVPGSRVSVRFGGRVMTGWLVSREQEPTTGAQLTELTGVPHLDREFDYLVPVALDARAVPGSRVSVRFGGRVMTGWLVSREQEPTTGAQLTELTGVPHLDREFDYLVPVALDARAVPGSRVSVRFGGRVMTGWLVSR